MVIHAHDLIEISDLSYLCWDSTQDWIFTSLERTRFVVVRRAQQNNPENIPVGIRGNERFQRKAAFLHQKGIKRIITPYTLAEQKIWQKVNPERQQMPVIAEMDTVMEILMGWKWGPTGSAGFELAAGYPALKTTSDLDLVIDSPKEIDFLKAKELLQNLDTCVGIRVDIQVETGDGAFLLREWVNQRAKTVVLRTQFGPQLVGNPWCFNK